MLCGFGIPAQERYARIHFAVQDSLINHLFFAQDANICAPVRRNIGQLRQLMMGPDKRDYR